MAFSLRCTTVIARTSKEKKLGLQKFCDKIFRAKYISVDNLNKCFRTLVRFNT